MSNSITMTARIRLAIITAILILIIMVGMATSMFANQPNSTNTNPTATPAPTTSATVTPIQSPYPTSNPISKTPTPTPQVYSPNTPSTSPQYTSFESGLNYLSYGNCFYQKDSVTRSDFEFFKANNIRSISIRIFMKSFILDHDNLINNYNRLLAIADDFNMKVQLDFRNQLNENALYPVYFPSIYDIIRNSTAKQMWFGFINETMVEFKHHNSIESWSMMSEPYINVATDEQLFYQCWTEQRELMKSIDPRPVLIRFALGHSPWSGDFNKTEVFKVCDYIAINEYLEPWNASYSRYGGSWSMFEKCVTDCKADDKPLIISEFGSDSGDDEAKRIWYEQSLSLFKSKGIQNAYAWAWQTINPESERFNIAGPTLKPAFYELVYAFTLPG